MIDDARSDPQALRTAIHAWAEHERAEARAASTIADRWRTLAACLGVIARVIGEPRIDLGRRPRPPRRALAPGDAPRIVADLYRENRMRDAVIVGLIGVHGYSDREIVAFRVRDVAGIARSSSSELAEALRAACGARPPQAPLLRGHTGRALSRAAVFERLDALGLSVTALRALA